MQALSRRVARIRVGVGPVEKRLGEEISSGKTLHFTLIDPEKFTPKKAARVAQAAAQAGSAAILVGGSTVAHSSQLDSVVRQIKRDARLPVILFPGNVSGISPHADAILFMSLLNSTNPYFLIGAQALGAPVVKRYGLEAIPLGYLIVGYGGAAGIIGYARPIPYDKPEIAAMHALAAQYLGMRFVYLEAGSGAGEPVPPAVISKVKKAVEIPVIVGGGIRSPEEARQASEAGADIVVTGTLMEEPGASGTRLLEMISALKR